MNSIRQTVNKKDPRIQHFIIFCATILVVLSVFAVRKMPVSVVPEFSKPTIEVQTEALGLSASDVENLVTLNLEEMLITTPWLEEIRSNSVPGLSSIVLTFSRGTDLMKARQMVAENLTLAYTIPNVSKAPIIIQPLSSMSRVMMVGLSSEKLSLIDISELSRWNMRPALLSVPGVANVSIWGYRERQIQVQVDQKKLQGLRVSLDQIIATAGNALWVSPLSFLESSAPGSGGWIDTPNQRLGIHHFLPIDNENDFAKIPVMGRSGLALGDVGDVVEGNQPLIGDALHKGKPGVLIVIEKFPGSDTLAATRGIEEKLRELAPSLSGVAIDTEVYRPATYLDAALDNHMYALLWSSILLLLAFFIFFSKKRVALISFVSTAFSFALSLFALRLLGFTADALLFAGLFASLPVVLYIIVAGVRAETRAIISTALISLLSVIPVFFMQDTHALFFGALAVAYALSVAMSALMALVVVPALQTVCMLQEGATLRNIPYVARFERSAMSVLKRAIKKSALAVVSIALVMVAGGMLFTGTFSLLPDFQEHTLVVDIANTPGISRAEMMDAIAQIYTEIEAIEGVDAVSAHIGRAITGDAITGIGAAKMWVGIDDDASYEETKQAVRDVARAYPFARATVDTYAQGVMQYILNGSADDTFVRLYGSDFTVLNKNAEVIKDALASLDGIEDAQIQAQDLEPQIQITTDIERAKKYGLKPGDVRRAASTLINGIIVGNTFKSQKVYEVVVWSTPETRADIRSVEELLIDTPTGAKVKLKNVANIQIAPTQSAISREAMSRYIDIRFSVAGRNNAAVLQNVAQSLRVIEFPLEYHAKIKGAYTEKQKAQTYMAVASVVAAIAIFLIFQSIFGSFRLAILAFITIPTALSGGVLAAYFTGNGILSLGSLVGFLTIFGISARNSIMLLRHYQHLEQEEAVPFGLELVLRGAQERFTPILMTALATALALLPLVIAGNIPGHEIEYPMALVILGGLITTTALNFFVAPALYLWFGRKGKHTS